MDFNGFDKLYRVSMYLHHGDCVLLGDALRTHAGNGQVSPQEQDMCLYLAGMLDVCAHVLDSSPAVLGLGGGNGNGKGGKLTDYLP